MKSNQISAKLSVLALATISALSLNSARAIPTTYIGATNSSWSNGANWSAGEPTAADDAIFNTGVNSFVSAGEVAQSVTFATAGATLAGGNVGTSRLNVS